MNTGMHDTGTPQSRWRPAWRGLALLFLSLACLSLAHAQTAWERGTAEVGVIADLSTNRLDDVTVRIVDNTDTTVLAAIAQAIAAKLNTTPTDVTFAPPDPEVVHDHGIGLRCQLPLVSNRGGRLPIGPFVEALASYVHHIEIAYIIQGPFIYTGYEHFTRSDVEYTVDKPDQTTADAPQPVAFYGVHAIIRNSTLQADVPDAPPPPNGHRTLWLVLLGVLLAGIVGACVGFIMVRFLPARRAREEQGAEHDRR